MIAKEEFSFRPYIHTSAGISPHILYEEHEQQILLSQQENLELLAMAMAAIVALGLLPFKLETGKVMALDSP